MVYLGGQGGYFEKLSLGSETLDMTSEGLLGEMSEKLLLVLSASEMCLLLQFPPTPLSVNVS